MSPSSSLVDRAALAEQQITTRRFALTFIAGGVGSSIASLVDSSNQLFTAWDDYGTAIISLLLFLSGLLILWRPRWLTGAVLLSLIPASVYQYGVMAIAVHQPSAASYYSAISSGPFFPLYYVAAFVMMPRGALAVSAIHCAGFYVQFALNATVFADPQPSPERHVVEHLLIEMMMAHPVYIVALSYIVKLRERIHALQQQAFRNKEQFIGMLSHEIRNQLQTMVGAIDLLDVRISDAPGRRSLARLHDATAQLQTYLRDAGELTSLEDPALKIETSRFDLTALVDEIVAEWAPQARKCGLQLAVEWPAERSGQPLLIDSDRARVRQIVGNLLSNAIKYTNTGGVTVTLRVDAQSPGWATLEVRDTGIGIDARHIERISQPYVRLDNAKASGQGGSGLGLTIVELLVHSLGGTLSWQSELDRGSTFCVRLPGIAAS
jgi:signal transduction histidine kinase